MIGPTRRGTGPRCSSCSPSCSPPPAAAEEPDAPTIQAWLDSVVLLVIGPAWCTGVVVDEEGTVATAYHCVTSGRRPQVRTRDGERHKGRMVAASAKDDLALVRVPDLAGVVHPLPIHPDHPAQGDVLFGLGHPFAPLAERGGAMEGMLQWSVSRGITSAVGPRLIQTDTALNPGNSGGPVVDAEGRIVGIASRKLRGDNVAFLASAEVLRALLADPHPPHPLGGQWFLGLTTEGSSTAGSAQNIEVLGGAIVRDRVLLAVGAGLPFNGRALAIQRGSSTWTSWEASLSLRGRVGRGGLSPTFDLGGGIWGRSNLTGTYHPDEGTWTVLPGGGTITPGIQGRLGLGGVGVRLRSR